MDDAKMAASIRELAGSVKTDAISSVYTQDGPRSHSPAEAQEHRARVVGYANDLEKLADAAALGDLNYNDVDAILAKVRSAGFVPDLSLVNKVAKVSVGYDF